jgi:malate dehydrogenase
MPTIAVIGAGPLGGALAHKLAGRDRVAAVRLIDPDVKVAQGKALDILQSSPIESFRTRLDYADGIAAAAGADAVVIADLVAGGEVAGETGLALVRQLSKADTTAPVIFAGPAQRDLIARARVELHIAASRLIGSAALALESSVRAVVAALLDASPVDLSIGIAGVPPKHAVIGWDAATAFAQPLAAVLPAHHMAAVSARLPGLWPPSIYTLASAAARVAEAAALGSRRRYTCFAVLPDEGGRNLIAAVPVAFRRGGIARVMPPALSRHEQTAFENGLVHAAGS